MIPSFLRTLPLWLAVLSSAALAARAQAPAYKPLQTFAPLTLPSPPSSTRASDGAPGPLYWQNSADYTIDARLEPATKTLTATEQIVYTNHSPTTLEDLWLNVEQNLYRQDARAKSFIPDAYNRFMGGSSEGELLDAVEIGGGGKAPFVKADTLVSDTRLQIRLPPALALRSGQSITLRLRYHYTIPAQWGGRTSWGMAQQGEIYDIAQWYPRMCVYDDLRGWNTEPYLANEFFLEYGNFRYAITVPANFIVAGSGQLTNPSEVLTLPEQARLAQARSSDATIMIRSAQEAAAASGAHPSTTKTWRFFMQSTRDVSFSASPAFLWDAARMHVTHDARDAHQPHATGVQLAQSFYPIESAGPEAWGRSTEYLKDSVEHFSARWYPYPYPNAINVAGFSSGMEYPAILFDGIKDKGAALFWITAHEIGHTWFPMIVGFNERTNAWMDEGFNTFIDTFESDEFSNGIYGPKRDGEYAPDKDPAKSPADQLVKVLEDPSAPVLLTRADAIREPYRHPVTYFKSAFGLTLLRSELLGPERFDFAFRKFIREWAYKHPSPSDFFRAMASDGGENLDYFWRGWYFNNWSADFAVTAASYDAADAAKLHVTLENKGQLVLPFTLRLTFADGQHRDVRVPAETWLLNTSKTLMIPTAARATSVTVDPLHSIPDRDRSNNTFAVQ